MQRVKHYLLAKVNILLGAAIALLACGGKKAVERAGRPIMCMYGVPNAVYHLNGKVTDSRGQALAQQPITIKRNNQAVMGQVVSDDNGQWSLDYDGFPTDTIRVVVETQEGQALDSTLVKTKEGRGSKGFYMGESQYKINTKIRK